MGSKKNTKDFILKVAAAEVSKNGYFNTSFNDLIKKTGLSKGAFYYYFQSKQHLCMELIDLFCDKEVYDEWLSRFDTPLNTINILHKSIENKLITYYENGDYKYGSVLNNLLNELSNQDDELRVKIQDTFDHWIYETTRFIKQGQKSDYIKKNFDAKLLANYYIQNSLATLKILKSTNDFDEAYNYFKLIRKTSRTFRAD